MKPVDRPSPNWDSRGGMPVDMLVLHYTGMPSGEAALARMCDPAAKVSAHYMIDENGTVHALVPEEMRAWHAGVSYWAGARDINARSIGIELVNPGHEFGYRAFPEGQIAALIELASGILTRHPIAAWRVLGHSDVAPMRKDDPGELFPWPELARQGTVTQLVQEAKRLRGISLRPDRCARSPTSWFAYCRPKPTPGGRFRRPRSILRSADDAMDQFIEPATELPPSTPLCS